MNVCPLKNSFLMCSNKTHFNTIAQKYKDWSTGHVNSDKSKSPTSIFSHFPHFKWMQSMHWKHQTAKIASLLLGTNTVRGWYQDVRLKGDLITYQPECDIHVTQVAIFELEPWGITLCYQMTAHTADKSRRSKLTRWWRSRSNVGVLSEWLMCLFHN